MDRLVAVDKDIAEAVFGWQPGRPTISRRAGGAIGSLTGMSTESGTALFHFGLVLAGALAVARLGGKK